MGWEANEIGVNVAVDAMGGDYAPDMVVSGAVNASRNESIACTLVGDEERLKALFEKSGIDGAARDRINFAHAPDIMAMDDLPTHILRKKESSMAVAIRLAGDGSSDAVFSAGNSGALVVGCMSILRRIKGVEKPGILISFPTITGEDILIIDAGASTDCSPRDILVFGYMGKIYAEQIMGRRNPSIGLFNIGEEAFKGDETSRAAYQLLKQSGLNFKGNIEGNAVADGAVDLIVCDGFIGNSLLKVAEGTATFVGQVLKKEFTKDFRSRLGAMLLMPALRRFKRRVDWKEWGGGVILGLKGNVLIGHGRSDARAIQNGLKLAEKLGKAELWTKIEKELAGIEV